ncbi:hypothetical protein ACMFKE_03145 [Staphylococcus haemolyticus]|uniref:aggregation-promoting factor C-terminal-like domain-containing protein n=1 Tax=Staphylococcus haemolyticus TaxID=1283 RepID=UPI0039BC21C4
MKKSIFALMTMVSLGAAGLESGQAHASEMTHNQQNQSCQYNQHTQLQHNQPSHQSQHTNVASAATTQANTTNVTTNTSSSNTESTADNSSSSNTSSDDNSSSNTSSDDNSSNESSSSESTSSVYKQFIAAGGTEELWEKIVLPESGGDPNASNGQYHGLGQTNQSWGYGSVETQTKGMISYAKERYGSIEAAISFRESNGWW